jgi:hypothetical protein
MTTKEQLRQLIREKAGDERMRIAELNKKISTDLKKLLKPASHYLNDIEGLFLTPETLRHPPHSARERSRWFSKAEAVLQRAVTHRKWVEGLVKKYGPDARTFGG